MLKPLMVNKKAQFWHLIRMYYSQLDQQRTCQINMCKVFGCNVLQCDNQFQ